MSDSDREKADATRSFNADDDASVILGDGWVLDAQIDSSWVRLELLYFGYFVLYLLLYCQYVWSCDWFFIHSFKLASYIRYGRLSMDIFIWSLLLESRGGVFKNIIFDFFQKPHKNFPNFHLAFMKGHSFYKRSPIVKLFRSWSSYCPILKLLAFTIANRWTIFHSRLT